MIKKNQKNVGGAEKNSKKIYSKRKSNKKQGKENPFSF
jgi:hypothetical protein